MSFHLLAYEEDVTAGSANEELDAVVDSEFSQRNSHFIFSERYNLQYAAVLGTSITRARLGSSKINEVARPQLWPVERSATVPDLPGIHDMRDYPLELPIGEELTVDTNNDLAMATELHTAFLAIAPPSFSRTLPKGRQRLVVRFTASAAGVVSAWSAEGNLTFEQNLRGGWYAIVGANVFDAGVRAFRFVFPRSEQFQGRRMRPGGLATEAIGNTPNPINSGGMGVWGVFHGFEPPTIQIFANATGASTQEGRLDVVYLRDDDNFIPAR